MLRWLVQSFDDEPDIARGRAPAGLLSPLEEARLRELYIEKRRREWLLGRWTAKRLVQQVIAESTGIMPGLTAITITNAPDGAPALSLAPGWSRTTARGGPYSEIAIRPGLAISLSISHRENYAFCAIETGGLPIGADIELIEPRSPLFVADYFTDNERVYITRAPAELRDMLANLVWSAKEAALKALRLGLTVDTRRIACNFHSYLPPDGDTWHAFDVLATLDAPAHQNGGPSRQIIRLQGQWRVMDTYVLTAAVRER